jgi:hypothetical protein
VTHTRVDALVSEEVRLVQGYWRLHLIMMDFVTEVVSRHGSARSASVLPSNAGALYHHAWEHVTARCYPTG